MADVVESVILNHQTQVVHLYDPNSVGGKAFLDVFNERVGVFKIVEHCDSGYDFGFLASEFSIKGVVVEIIMDYFRVAFCAQLPQIRRLKSRSDKTRNSVLSKQSAIVGTDVQYQIACRQLYCL